MERPSLTTLTLKMKPNGLASLLAEFFDHAQGDVEAPGDLVAGAFAAVVSADQSLP